MTDILSCWDREAILMTIAVGIVGEVPKDR